MHLTFLEHVIVLGLSICAVLATIFALALGFSFVQWSANPVVTLLQELFYIRASIFLTVVVYAVFIILDWLNE